MRRLLLALVGLPLVVAVLTVPLLSNASPGIAQAAATTSQPPSGQVSAGGRHTCAVRTDGTLWCWGANSYGQLGNGTRTSSSSPAQVGASDAWAEVSAGGMHTCAVRDDGSLWCWGLDYRGQLGIGSTLDQKRPHRVGDALTWRHVTAGWTHTCATQSDGSAWCWGDDAYGQLGDGTPGGRRSQPGRVSGSATWSQLSTGGFHTCGIRTDGTGWCWGRNLVGELGDGTVTPHSTPTPVRGDARWSTLQPSWTHTCGVRASGALSCWGGNEAGQLGTGDRATRINPTPIAPDRRWDDVSTGENYTCATDSILRLWCWGSNRYGQLGKGSTSSDAPVLVSTASWVRVDAGWLHSCGTTTTGGSVCWGNNETGALGDGTTVDRASRPPDAGGTSRVGARRGDPFAFNLATFNVLGSNHSAPRRDASDFAPARVRSEWAADYLRSVHSSIVGFQEIQRDQLSWFVRAAGNRYDVWPGTSIGPGGVQTSIAWKQKVWELAATDSVEIPFISQKRLMPLLKLRHLATGRVVWVMNIHNAPEDHQHQRNVALQREIDRLKEIRPGATVVLIGDFNERQRAFCETSEQLSFVAPRGGSYRDGVCQPPTHTRVDWIFGSRSATYSDYVEDKQPLVRRITDHAVLRTRVSVP